ncbi:hypothetical protein BD414DRAFT_483083 [Trametes punicea]|nr:hypothetical protein BD414DRAFT_483083 [Trametes punicea]
MMDRGRKVVEGAAAAGGVEKGKDERQSRQPSSDSVRTRAPAHTARPAPPPPHCPRSIPHLSISDDRSRSLPSFSSSLLSPALRRLPCRSSQLPPLACAWRVRSLARRPPSSAKRGRRRPPGRQWRRTHPISNNHPAASHGPPWERPVVHHPIPSTALSFSSPPTRPATCAAPAQRSPRLLTRRSRASRASPTALTVVTRRHTGQSRLSSAFVLARIAAPTPNAGFDGVVRRSGRRTSPLLAHRLVSVLAAATAAGHARPIAARLL